MCGETERLFIDIICADFTFLLLLTAGCRGDGILLTVRYLIYAVSNNKNEQFQPYCIEKLPSSILHLMQCTSSGVSRGHSLWLPRVQRGSQSSLFGAAPRRGIKSKNDRNGHFSSFQSKRTVCISPPPSACGHLMKPSAGQKFLKYRLTNAPHSVIM